MSGKWWIVTVVAVIVVGAGAFFGGTKAGGGSASGPVTVKQLQAMSQEEIRTLFQQYAQASGGFGALGGGRSGGTGTANGAGFINGTVVAKDAKSITVKEANGSTRIVFYSSSTTVARSTTGSISDIKNGDNITINGSSNSDGSLTAQRIQIRPPGETFGPVGPGSPAAGTGQPNTTTP